MNHYSADHPHSHVVIRGLRLDKDCPDFRLVLRLDARSLGDQVKTRRPVWLDRIDRDSLAPCGLGAELVGSLQQPAQALRAFGIDPEDPRKLVKLRELERRSVGEIAAAREGVAFQGVAFLPETPARFQGRLTATDTPGYAVVRGGRELVVLPMTRELPALTGRTVALQRDPAGKLRAEALTFDRGGVSHTNPRRTPKKKASQPRNARLPRSDEPT